MRIDYAIPAKTIDTLADGTYLVVGAGSDVRGATAFPAQIVVPLLVCIAASPIEAQPGNTHHLTVDVLDPAMQPTATPLDLDFGMNPGPNTPVGWEVRTIVSMAMAFDAHAPGTYSIELKVDTATKSVPIVVN